MIDIDRLEMVAEPTEFGKSAVTKRPVGQQLGNGWYEVKAASSAKRIGIEEGRYHHSSTIGPDVCGTIMRHRHLAETRQCITEAIEGCRGIAAIGIAHRLEG